MRKILVPALAALLVAPFGAAANAAGPKQQTVEGSVALPAPFTDDTGCFAGAHRRGAILTMENNNGAIGYHFDVDKATWNKNFVLEVTGGQGDVDLDIYFYSEFGTPEDVVNDPQGAGAPASVQYNTREPGGEANKVPAEMNKVIVCMYGGGQGAGAGATFKYTAGKGVKIPK